LCHGLMEQFVIQVRREPFIALDVNGQCRLHPFSLSAALSRFCHLEGCIPHLST
jgi:hypothetical protein